MEHLHDKLIIFGRSPFINNIDVSKINYEEYDVLCINSVIYGITPKYLVSADKWVKPNIPEGYEWISENTGWKFERTHKFITIEKYLSWSFFSSSIAVNFAILRCYKEIYLAGIDLDINTINEHYDGSLNITSPEAYMCLSERNYIKDLCSLYGIHIYSLNPCSTWLKFKDIGILKENIWDATNTKTVNGTAEEE